jgi:uncharacterized protein YcfJ
MKKLLIYSISALILSGCGSMDQVSRSIVATQTGAALGSIAGSIIGDNIGGYRGSYLGSFVGSAAGAMIGASIVARQQEETDRKAVIVSNSSPDLVIRDIRLQDENWNRIVEPNENCRLIFEIYNEGGQTAYDVKPIIKGLKGTRNLIYSPSLIIDNIKPGEGVLYKVNLMASSGVRTQEAVFEIYLEERNGFDTPKEEFSIRTQGD